MKAKMFRTAKWFIFINWVIMGCAEKTGKEIVDDPCIQYQLDNDGILISKSIEYKTPGIVDLMIHYYLDGSVRSIVQYRNGLENCLMDGWCYFFDSLSQNITLMEYYVDGKCRKSVGLYPGKRKTRFIGEIFDGRPTGSIYNFDTTGFLTTYLCVNFNDHEVYRKTFYRDHKPKVVFEQEEIIAQYGVTDEHICAIDTGALEVGTLYMVHVVIPKPPDFQRNITFSLLNQNRQSLQTWNIHDTTGVVSRSFQVTQPGQYLFVMKCNYVDKGTRDVVKRDSLSFDISFKGK
jgi:hypothetical protein